MLFRSDLANALLRRADLRLADLSDANFYGAILHRADLSGANLAGTDLRWADLTGTGLVSVKANRDTKWPARFEPLDFRKAI